MYSKKDFDRDYKRNKRDVKQFKPCLIILIVVCVSSLVFLIVGHVINDLTMYVMGLVFFIITLIYIPMIVLFYHIAKNDLKRMNAGEETYIKAKQKEELEIINRRIEKNIKRRNSKSLNDEIDEYIFYDEIFDD